jgi:hypothetical protein
VLVVVPEDQRVKAMTADGVPTDDELLAPVNPEFLPCARALARLIGTLRVLRDESFKTEMLDVRDEVVDRRIELR